MLGDNLTFERYLEISKFLKNLPRIRFRSIEDSPVYPVFFGIWNPGRVLSYFFISFSNIIVFSMLSSWFYIVVIKRYFNAELELVKGYYDWIQNVIEDFQDYDFMFRSDYDSRLDDALSNGYATRAFLTLMLCCAFLMVVRVIFMLLRYYSVLWNIYFIIVV